MTTIRKYKYDPREDLITIGKFLNNELLLRESAININDRIKVVTIKMSDCGERE